MNAVVKIGPQPAREAAESFNPIAAYERERAHARKLERTLSKALTLLRMECTRRELRGEDVAHIRQFITEASA